MPDIDGECFIRMVRGPGGERDLAVVAMSGTVDPFLEARLRDMGADAVLDKGAGAAAVAAGAEAALERKKTGRD